MPCRSTSASVFYEEKEMNYNRIVLSVVFLIILGSVGVSSAVVASTYIWSKETESYRIYMEVVPAELVKHQPDLLDEDKQLHNVSVDTMSGLSHVLVWIYQKPGNVKALDVTVIAEAGPAAGNKLVKPLEKMRLKTGVTYGNLFKVHRNEKHVVSLKIYASNRSGYEEAVFEHGG